MNKLRKLVLALVMGLAFASTSKAAWNYSLLPDVSASNVTEVSVLVSSLTQTTILASNADRLDFDVSVSTCVGGASAAGISTTKIYYAYDTVVSSGATNLQQSAYSNYSGVPSENYFRKPRDVNFQGAIYGLADTGGCYVTVREVSSTSQVFR